MRKRQFEIALLALVAVILVVLIRRVQRNIVPEFVQDIAISPDASLVVRSSEEGLAIFDRTTGRRIHNLSSRPGRLVFSPDSQLLLSGEWSEVVLWDLASGNRVESWHGRNRWCHHVAFSANGAMFAAADNESVRIWNTHTRQLAFSIPLGRETDSLAFSPDGSILAVGGTQPAGTRHHAISLWDTASGKLKSTLVGPEHCYVQSLAFSPQGTILATGLSIASVRLWDVGAKTQTHQVIGIDIGYGTPSFSKDGKRMAVCGHARVSLIDVSTGQLVRTWSIPHRSILAVTFSDDSMNLIAAGSRGGIYLLNSSNGEVVKGPDGLTLCPTGWPWLIMVAYVGWIILWTLLSGAVRQTDNHNEKGEAFAFGIVSAATLCSIGHWLFILRLAEVPGATHDPIGLLLILAFLSLVFLFIIAAYAWKFRKNRFSVCCATFSILIVVVQLLYDIQLAGSIAASV